MRRLIACAILLLLATNVIIAQSEEITPGHNLIVEGIPKIPASLAQAVGRYSETNWASLYGWHPTKREMFISTHGPGVPQLYRVASPGGPRTNLTSLKDGMAGPMFPRNKSDYFLFFKDAGGNEVYQIFRFDLTDGKITQLTNEKAKIAAPVWSNSGDWLLYGSTKRNGKDMDLYAINTLDPKSNRIVAQMEGPYAIPLDCSPDDQKALVYQHISVNESNLWVVDMMTGEKTLVTPQAGTEKVAHWMGRFSKDGRGVYVTTDRDSEFQRLAYIDLATKKYTYLTSHIKWDVDELALAPDGKTLAFVTNEDGVGRLRLLDTATGREKSAPALPTGLIGGLFWHRNGRDLGFVMTSPRFPNDVFSMDVQTGKVERWTHCEAGGVKTENLAEAELIRWKSFDEREISGFLYRPPTGFGGKRPVIIDIHGGPESQFRPNFSGRENYILNELGVALIFPNIRGSAGYGKTFLKLDNGFLREGAYKDIGALLDWIRTRADLDADRVIVRGMSYGGYIALSVATHYNDRIRATISSHGLSNFVTFLRASNAAMQNLRRVEYGDERDPQMREYLESIAPQNHADKIKKPLFIIQGENDARVPASEAKQMVEAARKNKTPVWYLSAKDEGHGFTKGENLNFKFYATVLFIKEHLLK